MTLPGRGRDPRTGSARQIASARLMEFADGPERGQRALILSSGGGLDLVAMADRSFDIGELRIDGRQIAWLGPQGLPAPGVVAHAAGQGQGFVRGFGGFLVTCGLTHFGPATETEPQHGRFPYLPARLLAHGEEFEAAEPVVFGEAETVQARYGGEALQLRRRIELPVGGRSLRLRDTIRNIGPGASPLRVMYHFNLGFPLLRTGAVAALDGTPVAGPVTLPDPDPDLMPRTFACDGPDTAACTFGNGAGSLRVTWSAARLPFLQIWHDLTAETGVFSVEPRTARPSEPGPALAPGEETELCLTVDAADLRGEALDPGGD